VQLDLGANVIRKLAAEGMAVGGWKHRSTPVLLSVLTPDYLVGSLTGLLS
jgi:hypothetical protein